MKPHRLFPLAWICLAVSLLFTGGLNGQISSTSSSTRPISEQFRWMPVPATLSSPGKPGDFASDGTDLYIYTGTGRPPHSWIVAGSGGGSGTVTSVNNVDPVGGNVQLTPDDLGAQEAGSYATTNSITPLTGGGPYTLTLRDDLPGLYDVTITAATTFAFTPGGTKTKQSASVTAVVTGGPWTITVPASTYINGAVSASTTTTLSNGNHTIFVSTSNSGTSYRFEHTSATLGDPPTGAQPTTLIYRALGDSMVAQSFALESITSATSMANGRLYLEAVWLPVDTVVTGVKWYQRVAGNYTGDAFNGVALFSYNAGTLTQVAISANTADCWKATSDSYSSLAFSSTYKAAAGLYFVGALYHNSSQTTAPSLGSGPAAVAYQVIAGPGGSKNPAGYLSSQTSMPASTTMGSLGTGTSRVWLTLY